MTNIILPRLVPAQTNRCGILSVLFNGPLLKINNGYFFLISKSKQHPDLF